MSDGGGDIYYSLQLCIILRIDQMASQYYDFESDNGAEYSISEFDEMEDYGQITPTSHNRMAYIGPQRKRRRPLFDYVSPYPPLQHCYERNDGNSPDTQLCKLIESQSKMMSMMEKLSDRIELLEKSIQDNSSSSNSASPGEKKRIPNNISVSE